MYNSNLDGETQVPPWILITHIFSPSMRFNLLKQRCLFSTQPLSQCSVIRQPHHSQHTVCRVSGGRTRRLPEWQRGTTGVPIPGKVDTVWGGELWGGLWGTAQVWALCQSDKVLWVSNSVPHPVRDVREACYSQHVVQRRLVKSMQASLIHRECEELVAKVCRFA